MRVKKGVTAHRRHKKILRLARGYWGARSKLFRPANEAVMHALAYAMAHRRKRKGDMRRLWIIRINAAARLNGLSYSQLISGLARAGIMLNRKMLAEMAVRDGSAFSQLAAKARASG